MLNRARLSDSNFVAPKVQVLEIIDDTESIEIEGESEEKGLGNTTGYANSERLFLEVCQAAAENWLELHADEILERVLSQHVMQPLRKKARKS